MIIKRGSNWVKLLNDSLDSKIMFCSVARWYSLQSKIATELDIIRTLIYRTCNAI